MRPARSTRSSGRTTCLARARPCVGWSTRRRRRTSPVSVLLWGPPGTGKTTLAYLVAQATDRAFVELSAVTPGSRTSVRSSTTPGGRLAVAVARRCCSSTRSTGSPRPSRTPCSPPSRTVGSPSSPRRRRTRTSQSSAPAVAQRPADAAAPRGGRRTGSARARRHRPARPRRRRHVAPDDPRPAHPALRAATPAGG